MKNINTKLFEKQNCQALAGFSTKYWLILLLFPFCLFVTSIVKEVSMGKGVACTTLCNKELTYTFKVADKLSGEGDIKLGIDGNKIVGIANGKGMTVGCEIDFLTNIDGGLDKGLEVSVRGVGTPLGIPFPGKISFYGPLKGFSQKDKLCLTGNVYIKGILAHYAGFKKVEEIVIEIPDSSLVRTFKEMQRQERLASL